MTTVTLARGSTSIDIQLVEESGESLFTSTFGKPEVEVRSNGGTLNPRVQDQWSGLQNFELRGRLFDYGTAHDLADLVKSASDDPLELTTPPGNLYPDTVEVAPGAGQEGALGLTFPAGKRDNVDVALSLTRVGETFAANEQTAQTPRASGTGPVEVRTTDASVELPTADLSLERELGRPNDVVRRRPRVSDPRYEVKAKVTNDVFTFSFQTVENIPATLTALTDNIFRQRLGRQGVTVDFNGLLGLGAIEAIPVGSAPFRQVHQAGRRWVTNPTLEFRRVLATSP
jgi:hypothetical protein